MKEYKRESGLIGAVIVFFLLLFVYTKLVGPIPFTVNNINTDNNSPFEVQGKGKASLAPDLVIISLGIREEGQDVLSTQEKVNTSAENLVNELKSIGVEEKNIKTTNYSLNPNYDFSNGRQNINGYTVEQNFEIRAPIEIANDIVDISTKSGANVIGNLRFSLNDDKKEELKNEARKEAVDMAKRSADGLSNASGVKLGKIINVRESFGNIPSRPYILEVGGEVEIDQQTPTNITPGESNIEVTVILTYETL